MYAWLFAPNAKAPLLFDASRGTIGKKKMQSGNAVHELSNTRKRKTIVRPAPDSKNGMAKTLERQWDWCAKACLFLMLGRVLSHCFVKHLKEELPWIANNNNNNNNNHSLGDDPLTPAKGNTPARVMSPFGGGVSIISSAQPYP
ncbi:hypothetical protein N9L68_03615 [bacterium]|nr:hypothetical protein [bacterium]